MFQAEVDRRADCHEEPDGSPSDSAAEEDAAREGNGLDAEAGLPDGDSTLAEGGHEAVTGARPETNADVEARADGYDNRPRQGQGDTDGHAGRLVEDPEDGVEHQTHDNDVGDGSDPDRLSQNQHRQEQNGAHEDHGRTDCQWRLLCQALVEHVPTGKPVVGEHDHAEADPEECQAQEQPRCSPEQALCL